MKKTISVLLALCVVSTAVFAQKNKKKNPEGWREKVRAEQVALITQELNLTEAEAQTFWPVYNDVQNQRREAFKACGEAMKTLREAEEGANYNALLDKYLSAKKKAEAVDEQAIARYKSVLPAEKIAKLVLAEEKFRHQQIGKLGGKAGRPGPAPKGQHPRFNENEEAPLPDA